MTRDRSEGHVSLLREAMAGTTSRRRLLRRGVALGLSVPALAGVVAVGRSKPAAADWFEECGDAIIKSFCDEECQPSLQNCRRTRRNNCQYVYQQCLHQCDPCQYPPPGSGGGPAE
jgi:hypothetical protein